MNLKQILIFIFSLTVLACSAPKVHRKIASEIDIAKLEQLVLSNIQVSDARKEELKILKENMMRYMIHASFRSESEKIEIIESANRYFQFEGNRIVENILLESQGAELDKLNKIQKVPRWTIVEEIRYLDSLVENGDNFLSVDQMHTITRTFMRHFDHTLLPPQYMGATDVVEMNQWIQLFLQDDLSNKNKMALMTKVEDKMSQVVHKIRNVGDEVVNDSFLKFSDPEFDYVTKKFIADYYKNIDVEVIKNIMSALVEINPNAPPKEIASVMFQYAGPGLGKTLQQLGKEPAVGEDIKKILATLEKDGLAVPPHLVNEIVAKDNAYEILSIEDKPLGTGTIAQVHLAKAKINGQEMEVVVRFVKPGVEDAAKKDIEFITKFLTEIQQDPNIDMSRLPNLNKLMKSTEEILYLDIDIPGTIQRQIQAQKVYQRAIKVNVSDGTNALVEFKIPEVYPPPKGKKSKLHVQEYMVHGDKFSNLKKATDQEAVARAMLDLWFSEALFRSGYIHADLHQGNFTILVSENTNKIQVSIFDFGMSSELPSQVREAFMMIAAGAQLNDSDLLARGLLSVEENIVDKQAKKELSLMIAKEMKAHKWQPEQWIIWAVKNGHLSNDKLGTLARGGSLILQLPVNIGKFDVAKKDLMQISKREFLAWLTGKGKEFPLKMNNLARISWSATRKSCSDIISKLFRRK